MHPVIRAAEPKDAAWIAEVWNTVITTSTATFTTQTKSAADIEARIAMAPVLVVPNRGFATYGPFRNGPGYAHVCEHSIYLATDAQGQGIGRALLTALEQNAAQSGIDVMVAGMSHTNPGAIRFHAAMGYQHVAAMPGVGRKWEQSLDLVLMQKNLRDSPDTLG